MHSSGFSRGRIAPGTSSFSFTFLRFFFLSISPSVLLLSAVLIQMKHSSLLSAMFVYIRVSPNNLINARLVRVPGFHSFPKWAMRRYKAVLSHAYLARVKWHCIQILCKLPSVGSSSILVGRISDFVCTVGFVRRVFLLWNTSDLLWLVHFWTHSARPHILPVRLHRKLGWQRFCHTPSMRHAYLSPPRCN